MAVNVVLRVELGTLRTGLWCDRCLLPSRVGVDAMMLGRSGVQTIATVSRCRDCGHVTK